MEVMQVRRVRSKLVIVAGTERFVVTEAVFRERPIQPGDDLDPDEYDEWLLLRQYRPALDFCVSLLAVRPYSTGELTDKLRRLGYRGNVIEMALYKLTSNDLLDDADFARQWAQSRANRHLGRSRIVQELRRKGISPEDTQAALDELDPDTLKDSAAALAAKGIARIKPGEDLRKARQRITASLIRRGFSYDEAKTAIEDAIRNR